MVARCNLRIYGRSARHGGLLRRVHRSVLPMEGDTMTEVARIDPAGTFRVAARQRKAAIRFPVSASDMAEAARFANETVLQLLPGFTDGVIVLQEAKTKERWSWNLKRPAADSRIPESP